MPPRVLARACACRPAPFQKAVTTPRREGLPQRIQRIARGAARNLQGARAIVPGHAEAKPAMRLDDMLNFRSFDGTRIAYRDAGEGPPVILLHGLSIDGRLFGPLDRLRPAFEIIRTSIGELGVAPTLDLPPEGRRGLAAHLLDAGARVIIPDLRGHGASDKPRSGATAPSRSRQPRFAICRFRFCCSTAGTIRRIAPRGRSCMPCQTPTRAPAKATISRPPGSRPSKRRSSPSSPSNGAARGKRADEVGPRRLALQRPYGRAAWPRISLSAAARRSQGRPRTLRRNRCSGAWQWPP